MSLGPMEIGLIVLVIVLLFGAKKLPDLARSMGRSMRIFKSEVDGMKKDNKNDSAPRSSAQDDVVTGEVVDNKNVGSTRADVADENPRNI